MEQGVKHLITCRCVLPQLESDPKSPLHQFVVFSVLDDDTVRVKYAQCNSCGIIHKVVDICRSEIIASKEDLSSIMTIDDIKMGLPTQLATVLEKNDVDLATWEQAKWIWENDRWGDFVILSNETVDGVRQIKYLRILGKALFQMNSHTEDVYI